MKLRTLIVTTTLSMLSLASAHAAAPINDSAAKAINLPTGFNTLPAVDLTTATAAKTDPLINSVSAGKTVWYKVTPPFSEGGRTYHVDIESTTGAGTVLDCQLLDADNPFTAVHVLSATAFSAATTTRLTVTFAFNDRTPRLLMFAGIGSLQLKVRAPLAENDYPSTAYTLTGTRGTVAGDNLTATTSSDEPNGMNSKNTVWYKWTPTFSGAAAADTSFSFIRGMPEKQADSYTTIHNTNLVVYRETSPGTFVYVTGDDDGGWRENSRVQFTATAGSAYYFVVGTSTTYVSDNPTGLFQLNYYQANTAGEFYFAFADPQGGNGARDLGAKYESEGTIPFVVARRYAAAVPATCQVATIPANGTATAGTDFQSISTTVSFISPSVDSDTAWTASLSLGLLDNNTSENTEDVEIGLSNPSSGATVDSILGRFYVYDDDDAVEPSFSLLTPLVRLSESENWAEIHLQRSRSEGGYFNLTCELGSSSTASADEFILPPSQSVYPAQLLIQLTATIRDDHVFEQDESIYLKVKTSYYGYEYVQIIIEDDDPFIPVTGRLSALLSYSNGARPAPLYATVSTSGTITGKLKLQGKTVPFVTKVDTRGKATALIPIAGRPSLSLKIAAKDATGGFHFSLVDGLTHSNSEADAVLQNYAATVNPCPEIGRYTFSATSAGWATATVNVAGTASLAGRLFDGTPFTMTGYVDGDGRLSAAASLYAGLGSVRISGDLPLLTSQATTSVIQCNRPARDGDPSKLGASSSLALLSACRYSPAANVRSSLECWSAGTGKATLTGGPLMNTLTKALTVNLASITAPVDADNLKLSVVPSTGAFSGRFVLPGSTKVLPFYGVLTQFAGANGYGKGFFFDGLKTGTITIGKP